MRYLLLVLSLLCLAGASRAQEAASEPVLQIEATMHTGLVRQLGMTADEKTLVTAGYDKTIRIWDVPEGKLRKVLRTPLGAGFEGTLYGVDITKDGRLIAASGWTKKNYVYIYDAVSGAIIKSFGPNGNAINKLRFSPDGSKVAVVIGGGVGIRMWNVTTGQLVLEDRDVGGQDCYGVDFRVDGVLAASCYDGFIRFYRADGKALGKVATRSGKLPYKIDFSPVDQRLAVGYNDATLVDVISASTFDIQSGEAEFLPAPNTSDLSGGDLGTVTWSKDGKSLYVTGSHRNEKRWNVVYRFWGKNFAEREIVYYGSDSTIDALPFATGGVALNVAIPLIALVDQGKIVMELKSPISLMGTLGKNAIRTSADGKQIEFGFDYQSKIRALFDVSRLEYSDSSAADSGLLPARVDGFDVKGATDTSTPALNGQPLAIDKFEGSRSLAVTSDGSGFALGTIWYIRRYDKDGKLLWRTGVPGTTYGISFVKNDQIIAASAGDGTVRWLRASDGKELLTLFIHAEDKRWVVWTPKGYYAASPGGEDLIGWVVNRSDSEAPDFFSASRFRDRFYRPDIIQKILDTVDEDRAIAEANKTADIVAAPEEDIRGILPPVVELAMESAEIKASSSPVGVSYRVRSPSGEKIEKIEVLIDGRPLEARTAIAIPADEEDVQSLDVPIPSQNSEIGLIAYTASGASEVVKVKVLWDGATADIFKPKLYAVVIGVSAYDNKDLELKYAAQDAADFAAALQRQKGGMYREVEARLIVDKDATRGGIIDALEWLEGEVTARDVGLVFLAGHGMTDNKQRFFFLPADADLDKLRSTAVSRDELLETMGGLAGKALMFIDACHSAASLQPGEQQRSGPTDITQVVNEMSSAENGIVMFASSTGRQVSVENDVWKNGAFTEALLEGFNGAADFTKDGGISIAELDLFLSERVKELTEKRQHPVARKPDTVPDYTIAIVSP